MEVVVDLCTVPYSVGRWMWLMYTEAYINDSDSASSCLEQKETSESLTPICLLKVTEVQRAFMEKQTTLLKEIIPWCYVIIKYLLILPLAFPVCIIINYEPDTFSVWECKKWMLGRLHNHCKSVLFSQPCTENSVYSTWLDVLVILLGEISLQILISSKEERWEVDFGLL